MRFRVLLCSINIKKSVILLRWWALFSLLCFRATKDDFGNGPLPDLCLYLLGLDLTLLVRRTSICSCDLIQWIPLVITVIIEIKVTTYFYPGIPMNKQLYTVSYMCLTGGAAGLAFMVVYVLVNGLFFFPLCRNCLLLSAEVILSRLFFFPPCVGIVYFFLLKAYYQDCLSPPCFPFHVKFSHIVYDQLFISLHKQITILFCVCKSRACTVFLNVFIHKRGIYKYTQK